MLDALSNHWQRFRSDDPPGFCYVHITLTDDGYLTSIDATRCSSDEARQAIYQRLAAAVLFPRVPGNEIWIGDWPTRVDARRLQTQD